MSTRAIAPILGVSHKTVVKDRQLVPEVPVDSPRTSQGMDGKTRVHQPRPVEPPKPKRRLFTVDLENLQRRAASIDAGRALGERFGATVGSRPRAVVSEHILNTPQLKSR